MDTSSLGRTLAVLGLALLLMGGVLLLAGRVPWLGAWGRLPGDIVIQRENVSCFIPIMSMILVSVVLTIALNLLARLLR